jgi:hypothetical protein
MQPKAATRVVAALRHPAEHLLMQAVKLVVHQAVVQFLPRSPIGSEDHRLVLLVLATLPTRSP